MFLSLTLGIDILKALYTRLLQKNLLKVLKIGLTGALTLLCFISFFAAYLYYGYTQFCQSPPTPAFCSSPLPNIYNYVQ